MARVVIIGAGLTGLSVAYHFEKQGFFDFTIFEKEAIAGGLCRSIYKDGFTFDFTGHLLHINDPYFHTFIAQTIGFEQLTHVARRSYIFSHNTFTSYPFQINLHGLPIPIIAECIEGYIKRKKHIRNPTTFVQWVLKHFGSGFARHFFLPYQKKIFAYDLYKITASWTSRFVPQTSLDEILRGTLYQTDQSIGYNAHFFYPTQGGIMAWINTIVAQLKTSINTNHTVTAIDMKKKVITFTNNREEPYDIIISTVPLDHLLYFIQEPSSTRFYRARNHLLCNAVTSFNLGIARPDLSESHWIYFPEAQYPFYRLGFPHNFSLHTTPPECSSLYGEIAHLHKSSPWVRKKINSALIHTKKLLNIADKDIITHHIMTIPHAYVIYNAWREQYLAKLLAQFTQEHIYSIGRYGAWKYSSMQEAVLDGKQIAEQCLATSNQAWYKPYPEYIQKQYTGTQSQ